jgi:hypothetical protein
LQCWGLPRRASGSSRRNTAASSAATIQPGDDFNGLQYEECPKLGLGLRYGQEMRDTPAGAVWLNPVARGVSCQMSTLTRPAFYVLSVVVLFTVAAVLAANLGFLPSSDVTAHFAKWGLAGVLAEMIALFGLIIRAALKGQQFALAVSLPPKLREIDISEIVWNTQKCVVIYGKGKEATITPVLSRETGTFYIPIPSKVLELSGATETIELKLTDTTNLVWNIKPFYLFYRSETLTCADKKGLKRIHGVTL